jgi:D-alanyl-D-alanine carboxypeptidase
VRAAKAAQLLERGFAQNPLSWLTPALGSVNALTPVNTDPPNLREAMCGKHRKRPAAEDEEDEPVADNQGGVGSQFSVLLSSLRAPTLKPSQLLSDVGPVTPIVVYTGPAKTPVQLAGAGKPEGATARPRSGRAIAAAAGPWTALSTSALAASPPAELVATQSGGAIPLPRPRPKIRGKSAKQ